MARRLELDNEPHIKIAQAGKVHQFLSQSTTSIFSALSYKQLQTWLKVQNYFPNIMQSNPILKVSGEWSTDCLIWVNGLIQVPQNRGVTRNNKKCQLMPQLIT